LAYNQEDASSLEQLLESLIKMVGKGNQKVDSLQKRVSQLEWILKEQHLEVKDRGPVIVYATLPPSRKTSETH